MNYSRDSRPIYFDALAPYVAAAIVGALMIGFGASFGVDGLRYGGTILDIISVVVMIAEGVAVSHKHHTAINCERIQWGLPLIGKDADVVEELERRRWEAQNAKAVPAPTPPLSITNFNEVAPNQIRIDRKIYPHPPTPFFLEMIFKSQSTNNRIPSEPSLIALGRDNGAWNSNETLLWLGALDEQGVTERTYQSEKGNAPRRIVDGLTLDAILTKFGYPAPPA